MCECVHVGDVVICVVVMLLLCSEKRCDAATCCTPHHQPAEHKQPDIAALSCKCQTWWVWAHMYGVRACLCARGPPAGLSVEPQQRVREIKRTNPHMVCAILSLRSRSPAPPVCDDERHQAATNLQSLLNLLQLAALP